MKFIVVAAILAIYYWFKKWNRYKKFVKLAQDTNHYYGYEKVAKMDWELIKKMYKVNPERWKAVWHNIRIGFGDYQKHCYLLYDANDQRIFYTPFGPRSNKWDEDNTVCIILPFFDWVKFMEANKLEEKRQAKLAIQQEKEEKKSGLLKNTMLVINTCKKDIAKVEAEANKQIEAAHVAMKEVQERIKKNKKADTN